MGLPLYFLQLDAKLIARAAKAVFDFLVLGGTETSPTIWNVGMSGAYPSYQSGGFRDGTLDIGAHAINELQCEALRSQPRGNA